MSVAGAAVASRPHQQRRILIVGHTFPPDPASVGQHVADVARELARRGYEVLVITSASGYEDPSIRYPLRETVDVGNGRSYRVRRLSFAGFGKKRIYLRVFGIASFQLQVLFRLLSTGRVAGIFFSSSPPLAGVSAGIANMLRGVPIAYWAMDLIPDELLVMGKLSETSPVARILEAGNRFFLRRSALIVALDRFMEQRLLRRGDFSSRMLVMPPWPHESPHESPEDSAPVDQATNPFRVAHGLVGKRVIMYSGNHSPANPLRTLLDAAVTFKDDDRLRFVFVGGGSGKKEVNDCIAAHGLTNMLSLPYQPISELRYSLSAGDVHVVSLGERMAGVIHPCKVYGAMALGRPILYVGPAPSHISDLLAANGSGWHVAHGDVEGMRAKIATILSHTDAELSSMGAAGASAVREGLTQEILLNRLVDRLVQAFPLATRS